MLGRAHTTQICGDNFLLIPLAGRVGTCHGTTTRFRVPRYSFCFCGTADGYCIYACSVAVTVTVVSRATSVSRRPDENRSFPVSSFFRTVPEGLRQGYTMYMDEYCLK